MLKTWKHEKVNSNLMQGERVGIVGAGIVGLAHAWSAAARGHKVTVFERSDVANGASIRNFGLVWLIGQSHEQLTTAMLSRSRWLDLAKETGMWVKSCGSLLLAHRQDEWEVLQEFFEFHRNSPLGCHLRLLGPEASLACSSAINPDNFLGSLRSDLELGINPTAAIRAIPKWLEQRFGAQFFFKTTVVDAQTGILRTADRKNHSFDRIIVCSGHDFETLFPDYFCDASIRKCKLQMMRTVAQHSSFDLGSILASGLTLRHYSNFQCCPSLSKLAERIQHETPELNEYGIHVMASQDDLGRLVLGDSHEYGSALEPFDSCLINELILRELQKIIRIPDWTIESRWHGIYGKSADGIVSVLEPQPGVTICTGLGGGGMTLSFGLAEAMWQNWNPEISK